MAICDGRIQLRTAEIPGISRLSLIKFGNFPETSRFGFRTPWHLWGFSPALKMCIMKSIDNLYSFGTDYLEISVILRFLFRIWMHSSVNRTPFGVASLGGVLRAVWESPIWATPLRHTTATSVLAWYVQNRDNDYGDYGHVHLR